MAWLPSHLRRVTFLFTVLLLFRSVFMHTASLYMHFPMHQDNSSRLCPEDVESWFLRNGGNYVPDHIFQKRIIFRFSAIITQNLLKSLR